MFTNNNGFSFTLKTPIHKQPLQRQIFYNEGINLAIILTIIDVDSFFYTLVATGWWVGWPQQWCNFPCMRRGIDRQTDRPSKLTALKTNSFVGKRGGEDTKMEEEHVIRGSELSLTYIYRGARRGPKYILWLATAHCLIVKSITHPISDSFGIFGKAPPQLLSPTQLGV